ncbi:hypothetical protein Naga_101460g1, partial [Nannochloropsis gaditana]
SSSPPSLPPSLPTPPPGDPWRTNRQREGGRASREPPPPLPSHASSPALPPSLPRPRPPPLPQLQQAARLLQGAFQLQLFGFDVIVPTYGEGEREGDEGGREGGWEAELVVVDVNFFPSFKEVEDFPARLRAFLRERAGGRRGGT